MKLELKKIKYHREKQEIDLTEPQALLLVSDLITAALAQNGFTATIEVKE